MENSKEHKKGNYRTFFIMLACSFVAMYITMYLNTYTIDHVYFSLTRFYMTCLGISAMAVIMWFFMRKMYNDKKKNIAILAGSFILFIAALGLVRTQKPIIGDIKDPEVKKLAEEIIKAQRKEIAEMKAMIKRLEGE